MAVVAAWVRRLIMMAVVFPRFENPIMLCAIEIGMLIAGITTLARGELKLGNNWTIRGMPAYLIGVILTATLPLIAAIGFVAGFMMGLTGNEESLPWLAAVDLGGVALSGIACMIVAALAGDSEKADQPQSAATPYLPPLVSRPMDPANPYATPSYYPDEQRR